MGRRSQRQWAWLLTFVFAFMLALGMAQRLPVAAQQSPGNPAIPQIILPVDTGNHWGVSVYSSLGSVWRFEGRPVSCRTLSAR
ncbi:MAG: hypothetical protein HC839_02815 [Leptolyngbyaceae cyanobacterium RM2_2_21]|nr:hypothetical protein [Leptolyngbyaceae cyanobacterium RM2_2_21]